jgi:hypothetical protein
MRDLLLCTWSLILLGCLAFFFYREVDVVPLPLTSQVMGDFRQLSEEPGQDGWEQ